MGRMWRWGWVRDLEGKKVWGEGGYGTMKVRRGW